MSGRRPGAARPTARGTFINEAGWIVQDVEDAVRILTWSAFNSADNLARLAHLTAWARLPGR